MTNNVGNKSALLLHAVCEAEVLPDAHMRGNGTLIGID